MEAFPHATGLKPLFVFIKLPLDVLATITLQELINLSQSAACLKPDEHLQLLRLFPFDPPHQSTICVCSASSVDNVPVNNNNNNNRKLIVHNTDMFDLPMTL